jgi:hypothetical protein
MWQQYLLMDRQHAVALENESLASLNLLIVKFLEILCLFDLLMTNDISTTVPLAVLHVHLHVIINSYI